MVNRTVLMECLFDIMNQNNITIREFVVSFFKSRVRNKEYQETFIEGMEKDIKGIHIADSRDLHEDLFKLQENK